MNRLSTPLQQYRRNVPLLFVIRCLGFGIAIPISVIVDLWSKFGITMTDVGLLEAIFAWSIVVMEIPSGVFADRCGRKTSLLLGCLFWVVGAVGYILFGSYEGFIIAEIFLALGAALNSGADEAILYDSLVELRVTHKYAAISSRMTASTIFLCAFGGIVGSWAHAIHYRLPWVLAATFLGLRVPLVLLLRETPRGGEQVHVRRGLLPSAKGGATSL
jgi:MFS family permease